MKELDVLLERYLAHRYAEAPAEERHEFSQLLDAQDPVLYAYCMGQAAPPEHLESLIARIVAKPATGP
jgi:antitoxin CptB